MSIRDVSLRNCKFKFRCTKEWTELQQTQDPKKRFCGDCKKPVHFCSTPGELWQAIASNLCVAIELGDATTDGEPQEERPLYVGEPAASYNAQASADGNLASFGVRRSGRPSRLPCNSATGD